MATAAISTLDLADLGATVTAQSDNSYVVAKGWFESLTITAQDAEELYQFMKIQRQKAGLAL